MRFVETLSLGLVLAVELTAIGYGQEPAEPLLRQLPPGIVVDHSLEVPVAQTTAISQRLGSDFQRLTNSRIRVHGRPIQLNVLTAIDKQTAAAAHAELLKIKSPAFCVLDGSQVIEYVGRNIDEALAIKTSYELGVLQKPSSVRYRIVVDLAAVDQADYMASNLLFNQLLAVQSGSSHPSAEQIEDLSSKFTFGRHLPLRNPALDGGRTLYAFQPPAEDWKENGASIVYSFTELLDRRGIPYVTATITTTVDDTGFQQASASPPESLTAATPFWPADDPGIAALARQITQGKTTGDDKVAAILEWLTPGRNLSYSGQTGSRWGTAKVLEQKFGHCWDFSDCFVTLARAAGVSSRQVAGWLYGTSGHVWAEYYRDGEGWQQVDPTGGDKLRCGIYHIPYFTSADGEMPILYVAMPKIDIAQPLGVRD